MILVDIGNSGLRASRVKDGVRFHDQCVYRLSWSAAVASQRKPSPEQESAPNQRWCELKDDASFDWLVEQFQQHVQERWLVSCVQQTALNQLEKSLKARGIQFPPHIVRQSDLKLEVNVHHPEKTGIDRLLAASAAWQLASQSGPIVVVQAGTAVTVDYIDEYGVFQGGAIMPGLGLALQLLAAGTEQLPWLGNHLVHTIPELPGKNTTQAISAGVNAALVGGVSHLTQRYRHHSGKVIVVYVSGGDGQLLVPHIQKPVEFVEHLVLRGLSAMDWTHLEKTC
jgi:type III pantothenate kinase